MKKYLTLLVLAGSLTSLSAGQLSPCPVTIPDSFDRQALFPSPAQQTLTTFRLNSQKKPKMKVQADLWSTLLAVKTGCSARPQSINEIKPTL